MDGLALLRGFLEKRDWSTALTTAGALLADTHMPLADRLFCMYAQCRAFGNTERFEASILPGQRGLALAFENGLYDVAGQMLQELSYSQYKLTRYLEAAHSLEEYLQHLDCYSEPVRSFEVAARINLGVAYRAFALPEYREKALASFMAAWLSGRRQGNERQAEYARTCAVWEALLLRRVKEAEELMAHGDIYQKQHPQERQAHAMHMNDHAKLAWIKDDIPAAIAYAMAAALQAESLPDEQARAYAIICEVASRTGLYEAAAALGLLAVQQAYAAERYDLAQEVKSHLDKLMLKAPEAVIAVVEQITEPR